MNMYDAEKVRFIKRVHLAGKKGNTLIERQDALQQYREWIAAIANPALRPVLKLQPFGSSLLLALTFIGWISLISAGFAAGLLIWGLVTWNFALLISAGVFVVQFLVSSAIQTAINTELGAHIQYVIDQGVQLASQIAADAKA